MVDSLSTDAKERLAAAVATAERQTGAEIVLAVSEACDDYATYPLLWAGALGFLFAGLMALVWPATHIRFGFLCVGGFILIVGALLHWPALRLALVPRAVKQDHAERAAKLEFAANVSGRTTHANGLLIFVALREHYVEIVPDTAIARAIPQSDWAQIVTDLLAEVRRGRLVEGLEATVTRCAALLAGPFPYRPDDRNEISDAVIFTKH